MLSHQSTTEEENISMEKLPRPGYVLYLELLGKQPPLEGEGPAGGTREGERPVSGRHEGEGPATRRHEGEGPAAGRHEGEGPVARTQ